MLQNPKKLRTNKIKFLPRGNIEEKLKSANTKRKCFSCQPNFFAPTDLTSAEVLSFLSLQNRSGLLGEEEGKRDDNNTTRPITTISQRCHRLESTPLQNSIARKLPLIFFSFLIEKFRDYSFSMAKKISAVPSFISRSIYAQLHRYTDTLRTKKTLRIKIQFRSLSIGVPTRVQSV